MHTHLLARSSSPELGAYLSGGGRSWHGLWLQTLQIWICHRERPGGDASFYPVQTGMSAFMWVELTEDSLTLWQLREHNVTLKPHRTFHLSLLRVCQHVCNGWCDLGWKVEHNDWTSYKPWAYSASMLTVSHQLSVQLDKKVEGNSLKVEGEG